MDAIDGGLDLGFLDFGAAIEGVANILPGLLTIQDALLDLVEAVAADGLTLQRAEDLLVVNFALFDLSASKNVLGGDVHLAASVIMGQSVDDQRATQNAARVLFEQGDQLRDDVNVGPGRHTRKRLQQIVKQKIKKLSHVQQVPRYFREFFHNFATSGNIFKKWLKCSP